jgi:hypothetical protein
MAPPRRLVLFVEGEGDRDAAPVLIKRLLTELDAWSDLFLDPAPFVVGDVAALTANSGKDWVRLLNAARKRPNLGAVLLLQDSDLTRIRGEVFCPVLFGARLSAWARDTGAGSVFSAASVFACQEYESWILACAEHLAGYPLPDGRPGIRPGTTAPTGDLDRAPRDAKGWLDQHMDAGYKSTRDQEPLTRLMVDHLDTLRTRGARSFRRLENALRQLLDAVRRGAHTVSPAPPATPTA